MKQLLIAILILASCTFAQKVLHISTIPTKADIYLQDAKPDHTREPDHVSPAFIVLDEIQMTDGTFLVSRVNPSFADTAIQVKLSDRDTSYLIVSQQPLLDESKIDKQESQLSKRARRSFGKNLMLSSLVPFAIGAAAGAFTYYEIHKADESKKLLQNSAIAHGDHYQDTQHDFKHYRKNAKRARYATLGALGLGGTLLTLGFILSF